MRKNKNDTPSDTGKYKKFAQTKQHLKQKKVFIFFSQNVRTVTKIYGK